MLTAKEIKALTGAKTKAQGINLLYQGVCTKFATWKRFCCGADREYFPAGYDSKRDLVHFTSWWRTPDGSAGHSRIGLPLKDALASQTGDLSNAVILL